MPTIKDVAKLADVSIGTVSKVLALDPTVKPRLRDRVSAAVKDLGYRPNLAARALRTNRIDVIGLVVPDITNPFFAQLAKCIEMEAALLGHTVMLANSHDDAETERRQLSALLDRAPRGIVIVAASDLGTLGYETSVPIISIDRRFGPYPLISTDHAEGAGQVAAHLVGLGHRRVAYIAGPQTTDVGRSRRDGFIERFQMATASDPTASLDLTEGRFDYHSGEEIGRRLLSVDPGRRPTAIAAASDQIAIGVMRAARDLGVSVPEEVSVTGFDDIELASLIVPRLTTLRQPVRRMGMASIRLLVSNAEISDDIKFRGDLVVRGSSAALLVKRYVW